MYVWRVWKNNRFVGYISSPSQYDAYIRATDEYGDNVWVERMLKVTVDYPKDKDYFCKGSQPA